MFVVYFNSEAVSEHEDLVTTAKWVANEVEEMILTDHSMPIIEIAEEVR